MTPITFAILFLAAAGVAAIARARRRSWLGWGLAALAVSAVAEIPLRAMIMIADPALFADASGRIGVAVTVYGAIALTLALILFALPRRAC